VTTPLNKNMGCYLLLFFTANWCFYPAGRQTMPSAGILFSISFPDVRVEGEERRGTNSFFWRSRPEISGRQTDVQIPCRSKISPRCIRVVHVFPDVLQSSYLGVVLLRRRDDVPTAPKRKNIFPFFNFLLLHICNTLVPRPGKDSVQRKNRSPHAVTLSQGSTLPSRKRNRLPARIVMRASPHSES